jgi:CRP/FNR family transcriptional regulator, cyclic AMP receptor protein
MPPRQSHRSHQQTNERERAETPRTSENNAPILRECFRFTLAHGALARCTPCVSGFTSEEELEIKIASEAVSRSLCAGSNAIRQASPASGPLTGSPSNRQAMKLPNIFEKDATPIPFTAGQIIFEEGQARDFMYVVKKGEVDIVIRGHVVETVGEDSFFGELALIDHAPRSATAIAKTDCELIKIDERQFLYLVQETPFFALIVMRTLAARIRRRNVQTLP